MTAPAKEVLFISIDGMTDPLGQSQVIPYLAGLRANGFSITILSSEKPSKAALRPKIRQLLDTHGIRWEPLEYKSKLPFFSQFLNYRQLRQKALELTHTHGVKLVHARSYLPALAALAIRKKKGIPFIFDMRGFWADERVDGRIWNLRNPVHRLAYRFFKRKERAFIQNAKHVISLTHNAKQEILSWSLPVASSNITVIPCCADFTLFDFQQLDPAKLDTFRASLHIAPGQPVMSYAGSLGTWYMLPEMLRFYKCLLGSQPTAIFLVITTDEASHVFEEAARQGIRADNIRVQASERSNMPYYLSLSSFSLFFIRPSYSKKASSPTKLAEILGCGIPVVTNTGVGDVDTLLREKNAGLLVSGFTEADYRQTLEKLPGFSPNKSTLFAIARENFDLRSGIQSYTSVYQSSILP